MNLRIQDLSFRYTGARRKKSAPAAVDGVDLEVEEGEFFSLLGPSGCGKTTLLWLVAGFHPAAAGRIHFGTKEVTDLAPEHRNVGMVFQNYALFPHLTVAENIAFGLRTRGEPHDIYRPRVQEMLTLVDLPGLGERRPGELSGGQQQRVALARALALKPDILLLDEPLSNLDAGLRVTTRGRIRALQKKLGLTTLYVTHDQEDALTMSDRLAILDRGRVLQVGTPAELYEQPDEPFVARFLGRCNLLKAKATGREGMVNLAGRTAGPIPASSLLPKAAPAGWQMLVMVRPESGRIGTAHHDPHEYPGTAAIGDIEFGAQFIRMEYLGPRRILFFDAPNVCDRPIEIELAGSEPVPMFATAQPVRLHFDATRARLLPPETVDETVAAEAPAEPAKPAPRGSRKTARLLAKAAEEPPPPPTEIEDSGA
ncbi:MAG: ABC transporter ATP-binding protein [Planctomycetota bacterium]